ncbi:Hypothetical_protein [Hexamita inflata]|uniref:Hypothetical_protein n=1 Tax=Hexamita inflata TaxID=28002 RepID=A0AA86NDB3_9EUKA|nr:Hypothetical protein HINF_LOCUS4790 [Hexamita inflata]
MKWIGLTQYNKTIYRANELVNTFDAIHNSIQGKTNKWILTVSQHIHYILYLCISWKKMNILMLLKQLNLVGAYVYVLPNKLTLTSMVYSQFLKLIKDCLYVLTDSIVQQMSFATDI